MGDNDDDDDVDDEELLLPSDLTELRLCSGLVGGPSSNSESTLSSCDSAENFLSIIFGLALDSFRGLLVLLSPPMTTMMEEGGWMLLLLGDSRGLV